MDNYITLSVFPDPEFSENVLMGALFAKLHRYLGQRSQGDIGVSFPKVNKTLGNQLRLHGTESVLEEAMASGWTVGLAEYVQPSHVQTVPKDVSYRTVRRVQCKTAHNKRSRSIRKGWLNEEEAINKIPDEERQLALPFIQIKSLSNGNHFRLYIEHGECQPEPRAGSFSSYGLSAVATVPWFD